MIASLVKVALTGAVAVCAIGSGRCQDAPLPLTTPMIPPPAPERVAEGPRQLAVPSPPPEFYARAVTPLSNPGGWITEDDYPAQALRYEMTGSVGFRLRVDPEGAPSACETSYSSGWAFLDRTTCDLLMRRARFRPALDRRNKPVASYFSSRVRWEIPPGVPEPITNWRIAGIVKLAADDTVISCEEQVSGPVPAEQGSACATFGKGLPAGVLLAIGGGGAPRTLIFEASMTFEDAPPLALLATAPSHKVSSLSRVAFDISEAGLVENCRTVPTGQEHWAVMLPSACTYGLGPFVPAQTKDGKPRRNRGSYATAVSLAE